MSPNAKILLVDDVNLMIELEKNFLHQSPVQILVAHNGQEALEIARRELPDLIFMDLNMPVMDGVACCRRIKEDPELAAIPVVMVTTAGRQDDIELCQQAGCDGFLTKPINRKAFLDIGRKFMPAIDRRRPRLPFNTNIAFRFANHSFTGLGIDISLAGVYIASECEAREGDSIEIGLPLNEAGTEMLWISGQVAWINGKELRRKSSLPPGFGVEFDQFDESSAFVLERYLSAISS